MRLHSIVTKKSAVFATSIVALFVLSVGFPAQAGKSSGTGGLNALDRIESPYLILISIDGFRWDYQSLYDTPALDGIAESGVRAEAMRPVYPSLTFPNHYSIATGLQPAQHGIVHNDFPNERRDAWYHLWDRSSVEDRDWYHGEPVWVAAEKSGMVSAAYYFVGTEAAVGGISPTYWYSFDGAVPGSKRVEKVIDWLQLPAEKRPHMITLYFEDVDDAGHDFGQGSAQLGAAVRLVDANIGRLLNAIDELEIRDKVNVLVVSDHGQSGFGSVDEVFILSDHIDIDGLTIVDGGTYAWIYQDDPDRVRALEIRDAINESWQHGRALLRDEAPARWQIADDMRYPEIFVVPDLHHGVLLHRDKLYGIHKGDHGWDPEHREMHGVFLASGPRLPAGKEIGEISVVDVYPLMLELLQIEPLHQSGSNHTLRDLIAPDE